MEYTEDTHRIAHLFVSKLATALCDQRMALLGTATDDGWSVGPNDVTDANELMLEAYGELTGQDAATSEDISEADFDRMSDAFNLAFEWESGASLDGLNAQYRAWIEMNAPQLGNTDAETAIRTGDLTDVQKAWLRDFCGRWDRVKTLRSPFREAKPNRT